MVRLAIRETLLALSSLAMSSAVIAAPPPAPPAMVSQAEQPVKSLPATPARMALAKQLVQLTQPREVMLEAVLKGWDKGLTDKGSDMAVLDELSPGLGAKFAERGKSELMGLVTERIPVLHDRLATLFVARCTDEELKTLIEFYSSPTGRKLIRSITMADTGTNAFEDEQITSAEATTANRQASLAAAKTLTAEERIELMKFAFSPIGLTVKAVSPKVQSISADWMTTLIADYGVRIRAVGEDMIRQALAKSDKRRPAK